MTRPSNSSAPPIIVIHGDEEYRKQATLQRALDRLLPPEVDRALALCQYDGEQSEDQGGATFATVADDLATVPFLAERRVVVIRDADKFVTAHRERLERFLQSPPPTGTLVLDCRSFPKTTRLYKAVVAVSGEVHECKKLNRREAVELVVAQAREAGKRIEPAAADQLVNLIGQDEGLLAGELEKLCLYAADRPEIRRGDVSALVGLSREEKIFAVLDAAAAGKLPHALALWHQVLATDPQAIYRALGGIAFKLRQWLAAQRMAAGGAPVRSIAPRFMMYGRDRELETILKRLSSHRLTLLLAALADLDSQAKSGARSIETGIEDVLIQVATPAA